VLQVEAHRQERLVRVSTGSAMTLGLADGVSDVRPSTAYLLTYYPGRCSANCLFCPQAKMSRSRKDLLSRVSWPVFPLEEVLDALARSAENVKRVCIQAMNYPNVIGDLVTTVSRILSRIDIGVSVSCQPVNLKCLHELHDVGTDRIGIPIDAATPELFSVLKGHLAGGPYAWERHMQALREAISVFGAGRVTTHVIVGLGETDHNMLRFIQDMVELGVCPALFAFTPIPGTPLDKKAPPSLSRYRLLQTARFLLVNRLAAFKDMRFDASEVLVGFGVPRRKLSHVIGSGLPYLTSGCPDCNRPFYNEKPSGPMYNFPRPLTPSELKEVHRMVEGACRD